jgi:hypothetical protein
MSDVWAKARPASCDQDYFPSNRELGSRRGQAGVNCGVPGLGGTREGHDLQLRLGLRSVRGLRVKTENVGYLYAYEGPRYLVLVIEFDALPFSELDIQYKYTSNTVTISALISHPSPSLHGHSALPYQSYFQSQYLLMRTAPQSSRREN